MPTWPDHAFAALLVLGLPVVEALNLSRFMAAARSGGSSVRIAQYRRTMAWQWLLVAALGLLWVLQGRPIVFALPAGTRLVGGLAATLAVLGILALQWRAIKRLTPEAHGGLLAQLEAVRDVMPRSDREHRAFRGVALTAGICEEILFRGFLIWYLAAFLGTWPAVGLSAVAFGLGHAYQGPGGIVKTGLVGLVAGTLYVLGGTLVWPMILHMAVDLQGGAVARRLLGPAAGA